MLFRSVRALRESMVYGCMVLFMLASLVLLVSLTGSLRQLAALTVRDALTGVFNRRHFDEVVRAELARVRRGGGAVGLSGNITTSRSPTRVSLPGRSDVMGISPRSAVGSSTSFPAALSRCTEAPGTR